MSLAIGGSMTLASDSEPCAAHLAIDPASRRPSRRGAVRRHRRGLRSDERSAGALARVASTEVFVHTLSNLYDQVVQASSRGDARAAHAAFLRIVGLAPRRDAAAVPHAQPPATISMLRYDRPRRIDILALLGGARPVAKFEDLSPSGAAALEAKFRAKQLQVVRVGPYAKRFDVAVSDEDGARGREGLYTVIASVGSEAQAVADAERTRGADSARLAGTALGYPACCVASFVAAERSEAARLEGINEAAIRSITGHVGVVRWEMNTLSMMSPIGFTPCRADCPEALAFARRVLAAVERVSTDEARVVKQVLSRPVLFFRYPMFFSLDAVEAPTASAKVRYARALPNDDGAPRAPVLHAWLHNEIGAPLTEGDEVELDQDVLAIRRLGEPIARWDIADARVPMLLRFGE
jgi:hypothetical protein